MSANTYDGFLLSSPDELVQLGGPPQGLRVPVQAQADGVHDGALARAVGAQDHVEVRTRREGDRCILKLIKYFSIQNLVEAHI